jgi:hypothetical protein
MIFTGRPNPEIAPAYAKYYLDRTIGQEDLMEALIKDHQKVMDFIRQIPEDKVDFHYADDKWSLKGVLLHTIETERVFQYRALRLSRKDKTPIEGFDEGWFSQHNNTDARTLADLAEEFNCVRTSTIHLFKNITLSMLDFEGIANNAPINARNIGWIIVGHTMHHCDIIKERYLVDTDEHF